VKENIAGAIGQIGKPEAHLPFCIETLIKAFHAAPGNENSTLKSIVIWAIGRLASFETGKKA
jgi:hypothetical protein